MHRGGQHAEAFLAVRPAAGSIDHLEVSGDRLEIAGWLLDPDEPLDRVDAHLGDLSGIAVPRLARPDVEEALALRGRGTPWGFALRIQLAGTAPRVDLIGQRRGARVARLSCVLPTEEERALPLPPEHLTERVSGVHGPYFQLQALRMFTDLDDQIARFGIPSDARILDWGCGCGRVTQLFATRFPGASITGCDIDAEALEWCRAHVRGRFVRVEPMPPTSFPDGDADVVIACSVLTHLSAPDQTRWVAEVRRVLAPGGYFIASTHGEHAYRMSLAAQPRGVVRRTWDRFRGGGRAARLLGIRDGGADPRLDGIAPEGYYRGTYQSRDHTMRLLSQGFEVQAYVERGLNGHQDLVVARRRD